MKGLQPHFIIIGVNLQNFNTGEALQALAYSAESSTFKVLGTDSGTAWCQFLGSPHLNEDTIAEMWSKAEALYNTFGEYASMFYVDDERVAWEITVTSNSMTRERWGQLKRGTDAPGCETWMVFKDLDQEGSWVIGKEDE